MIPQRIDRVTGLVAFFTLLLVAGLLSGGWIFHARMSEAFAVARLGALREQGALVRAALEDRQVTSDELDRLALAAGLDRLELLDRSGRSSFPAAVPIPEEDAALGLEFEAKPLREGDELFLTLYLPLDDALGRHEGYLLLEAGARLSDQLVGLRRGLWFATGAGALFVSFVLMSMALILRQARQRQRDLDRAEHLAEVGTLAAGLAHEIRNPLAIILAHSELLESEVGGKGVERAGEIIEEVDRLRRLLDDFLHYARPSEMRLGEIDLVGLWHRAMDEARVLHAGKEFQLEARDSRVLIEADPDRLRQIALNLLANAAAFSPEGGVVRVEIDGGEETAIVRVRDEGPGVSPDLLDRLFTPFRSGREGGTGLGLALSRSLARAHGGDLRLTRSDPGGSEFTLTIPKKRKGSAA